MTSYYEHGQQTNIAFAGGLDLTEQDESSQPLSAGESQIESEVEQIHENGHQNGEKTDEVTGGGVDQHFAYFRWAFDQANQSWYVQKAKDTYEATKKSFGPLERTLDGIESRVVDASQHAAPIYEQFVYPTTDRLAKVCSKGLENSKNVYDSTKTVATTGGTVGLGLAVIGTQLSLIASAALTSLLLDGVILTKNVGSAAVAKGIVLEQSVERGIYSTLESSRNLAKIPVEKINEHANGFLDVANALVDNYFSLPLDEEVEQTGDSTVKQRVQRLARRLAHVVRTRTQDNILEPCQRQLHGLADQLRKSLALVDIIRERRQQLSGQVNDLWSKMEPGQLSESMHEVWTKVESEAREMKQSPDEVLIHSIRRCSSTLNNYIGKLREKSTEILPAAAVPRFEAVASYVEQLDTNLSKANTIYEVKDEVLDEAKQKLQEVTNWTANFRGSSEKKDE